MTDIIQIVSGEIVSSNAPEGRVEDFLRSLDVSEKSRATYTRSLRQFISWLADKKGRGRISKSLIVELALQMALEDLRKKGSDSLLAKKLSR